ncbi:MAG TPA: alcohol dehydrogenase catalytic domain-containing protein [Blastocatellia bacterium]|nr:alcohol dehydrogenase catalytic domain-containing protein [Blastocatellia bacterium]
MRTLLYPEFGRLEIAERPRPEPAAGEVLLRVAACGICGSELEAFKNRSPRRIPPLVLGHEFCGVVDEIGIGVDSLARGQQVVSHSLFGCGVCVRCKRGDAHLCGTRQLFGMTRQGGFAEYVTVPEKCVVSWPDHLSGSIASLSEPLANGVHVVGLSRSVAPSVVAIIGAGPIGLMCQQAFQCLTTADVLVADLAPKRLEAAKKLGAAELIKPPEDDFVTRVLALTGGDGADVVVDAVGNAISKQQSLRATRSGGIAVWIGLHDNTITFDSFDVTLAERRIQGSYAASLEELKIAVDLLAGGRVDGTSWIKTFPLGEGVEAFGRMLAAKDDDIKAVLLP